MRKRTFVEEPLMPEAYAVVHGPGSVTHREKEKGEVIENPKTAAKPAPKTRNKNGPHLAHTFIQVWSVPKNAHLRAHAVMNQDSARSNMLFSAETATHG